jgi:ATP/maltotriose-dependent transcriptional regulator MalT
MVAPVLALLLVLRGRAREARPLLIDAQRRLKEADPLTLNQALLWQSLALMFLGEYGPARRTLERVVGVGRAASAVGLLPYPLAALCELGFTTGRWVEAHAEGSDAIRLCEKTGQASEFPLVLLAQVEAGQGREDDYRQHVSHGVTLAKRAGNRGILRWASAVLGLLKLGLGRPDEAVQPFTELGHLCAEHEAVGLPEWSANFVESCIRAEQREQAVELLRLLEWQTQKANHPLGRALYERCQGLLADNTSFARHFEEACTLHEGIVTPFEYGRTRLYYGERLRRAGQRIAAREQLRRALVIFERLDAVPWVQRAQAELRACGGTVRASQAALPKRLTAQELQVALAVAEGATNREAAAALFLSPKTIEFHLGNIYRKLGIRSRAELARVIVPHVRA